jgi:hypothetical protein
MNPSVSQIIIDNYQINARPGAKIECPFCKHKTMSIKRDDTLAKCFHPSCGRYITVFSDRNSIRGKVQALLGTMFSDFHRELVLHKNARSRKAYSYLVKERGIHQKVVEDSMLGVVPADYELETKFAPLIAHAQQKVVELSDASQRQPVKPAKSKGYYPKRDLDWLMDTKQKLQNCIRGQAGWIAFFYTDANHNVMSIRFRKPGTKNMVYFKPFECAGLFGHGLFSPYESVTKQHFYDNLIVTEGEFNQLHLQSLCRRYGELTNQEMSYIYACSVGGVRNADYNTIHNIARNPIFCYDNDASGAGFALVKRAQETLGVTAFTTPKQDSDLDDYIRSFDDDYGSAWESVRALIADRKSYPRSYEAVAAEIFKVRQKHGGGDMRKQFEIEDEVAEIIREDIAERGQFYHDGQSAYFFFSMEKQLVEIHTDSQELVLLMDCYGINPAEGIFKYILKDLWAKALKYGKKTCVHQIPYYNPATFTLYVFNNDNQIYRVSPTIIDLVDNGTDGILFLKNPKAQPFHVELPIHQPDESLLDKLILSGINFNTDSLSAKQQCIIVLTWIMSFFFESIMPTKPILAFLGPQGAGKTHVFRKIGKILLGEKFDVTKMTNDPKDFDTAVSNSPYVALDNVDDRCPWLNDKLATVATGGVITKRVLYTDNKSLDIPTHCFLAINSRSPHFRRDDVADRLLIINVDRYPSFKKEGRLLDEIIKNRDLLWTEILSCLQDATRALQENDNYIIDGCFRMADFFDFAIKNARQAGVEEEVRNIFDVLTNEQSYFTLEGDQIFDLLMKWASDEQNRHREVTNADLCQELARLAESEGTKFQYKGNNRGFAQRMRNLRPNLEKFFEITTRTAGGRKKYSTFEPKSGGNDG